MAKKYYAVNCHYDMVITVDVIAESEDEAIELAKQNADFASIDKWAECYGSSECIADEQELTDELQKQAEEQQAMFDEKDEQEHGKQIELDYDAGDTVTWHCDDDGQDHTSTITGISIEVNSEGEAEVTYMTEIEFKGRKQDAYFSEYDIVNK